MSIISKDSVIMRQAKNFRSLDIVAILTNNVNKNKKAILDRQREQLLFGEGNDGKKIKPKYKSDKYAENKSKQNSLAGFGTPDLNLSGDMFDGLDILVGVPSDLEYSIFSDVEYFNDLNQKYQTAFGINSKSMKVIPQVQNDTLKEIHKLINK